MLNASCRWLTKGNRDLTVEESDRITGGLQAGTICAITFHPRSRDGDCALSGGKKVEAALFAADKP
ncbi:MAG: hypothetical protein ACRD72_07235 [Candidatus Angelobacter sp.]